MSSAILPVVASEDSSRVVGMLGGCLEMLGGSKDDSSGKFWEATDDSRVKLGDSTGDCPGRPGNGAGRSQLHLFCLIASIRAFWARFLLQLVGFEAKGVAPADSLVPESVDCRGSCCSAIGFF